MRVRRVALVIVAGIGLVACGSAADDASDAADTLATKALASQAVGTWRCETDQVENQYESHLSTEIAIAEDGRFTYAVGDRGPGPQVGTWSIEDRELRLSVPWADDGRNGFVDWIHHADADPPTRLVGQTADGAEQDLDIDVSKNRVTIHQDDDGGAIGGVAYSWDTVCERTSSDPGVIPPTIPVTASGGD